MKKQKGFSLIELLVVITIIGILSVIGLTSYRVANQKARDSKRKADIQAIQSALEVYRSEKDVYPDNISDVTLGSYFSDNEVPTDPNLAECGYTYSPVGTPVYDYTLSYCLETDALAAGSPIVVDNP